MSVATSRMRRSGAAAGAASGAARIFVAAAPALDGGRLRRPRRALLRRPQQGPRLRSTPCFLTNFPSRDPDIAGARPAILGTLYLGMLLIAASRCRSASARPSTWRSTRTGTAGTTACIELNIQNLAAVPSIVYGILGLAFFVRGLGSRPGVLLAGALTLALLVLPIVIIAAREAIRAVPRVDPRRRATRSARRSGRWSARQVLPAAIPGIATGSILALARAIGETAPLILIGALTFVAVQPRRLMGPFTALPIQIFNWTAPGPAVQVACRRGDHRAPDHGCCS